MSTIRQCSQDTCRGELRIVLPGKRVCAHCLATLKMLIFDRKRAISALNLIDLAAAPRCGDDDEEVSFRTQFCRRVAVCPDLG